MKRIWIALLLAAGVASPAHASMAAGRVSYVHVMSNGVVIFHVNHPNARGGVPACAAGNPTRWAFSSTTTVGQARLSLLLTMYASQKEIAVYGTGTCPDWGDTESADWMHTNP